MALDFKVHLGLSWLKTLHGVQKSPLVPRFVYESTD